jgi:hypothetical protein
MKRIQSASKLLINSNYFYVDVQKQGHHEMNMVLEKKEHLMQKWWIIKWKNKQKEWLLIFFALKFFRNDFAFCNVCCNMNEESMLEKL